LFLFAKQTNPNQSKQEVNGTFILPPLVFPDIGLWTSIRGTTRLLKGYSRIIKSVTIATQNKYVGQLKDHYKTTLGNSKNL
jgi:FPC/CPF motif-containing protein YcgG